MYKTNIKTRDSFTGKPAESWWTEIVVEHLDPSDLDKISKSWILDTLNKHLNDRYRMHLHRIRREQVLYAQGKQEKLPELPKVFRADLIIRPWENRRD